MTSRKVVMEFLPTDSFCPLKNNLKTTFSSVISFFGCLGFFSDLFVDNVTMCLDLSRRVGEHNIILSVYMMED